MNQSNSNHKNNPTHGRMALGRGLDALIGSGEVNTDRTVRMVGIPLSQIEPNPDQPRRSFDNESLEELATSIRELGVVTPLTLRSIGNGRYMIIAGERRWRAASIAGLREIPAYIREADDRQSSEMALIENIQRQDLNAIDIALGFKNLMDTYNLTQQNLSDRLGKNRATIANHLRLLRLPGEIQLGLCGGANGFEMGHARALLGLDDTKLQIKLYKRIVKEGLSVRAVEELVKKANNEGSVPPPARKRPDSQYDELANSLSSRFNTPVKFSRNDKGRGTISFKFDNDDDLHRLIKAFDSMQTGDR